MKLKSIFSQRIEVYYYLIMAQILAIAVLSRFFYLQHISGLVFDEKYFVKFADRYLNAGTFFDSHPPLGKYLIALGIWIGDRLPFPHSFNIEVAGSLLSPWSYRWLNALVGCLIPLIIGAIAYELTHRYSYALIAILFAICDGLFLVESRYALINIYMVLFGLVGQLCLLHLLHKNYKHRWVLLVAAGVNFGASAAVKWNGLGFLLTVYVLWFSHGLWLVFQEYQKSENRLKLKKIYPFICSRMQISPRSLVLYLGIVPTLVYCLCWIPHIRINPDYGFWQVHQQLLTYHQNLGSGNDIHPYCSSWWSWPWMIRPIVYFYQTVQMSDRQTVIYTVTGMGNPILWWSSTLGISCLTGLFFQQMWSRIRYPVNLNHTPILGVWYYLIVNYLCNWLPWAFVNRCTFIYHYMSAAVFAQLAIAWLVEYCLQAKRRYWREMAIVLILVILLAFIFWLPLYLGLPLSPEEWKQRIWFSSWI